MVVKMTAYKINVTRPQAMSTNETNRSSSVLEFQIVLAVGVLPTKFILIASIWRCERASTSILTWHRRNLDQEGGSSRARPFHCTSNWLTLAITPNVGDSGALFMVVGDCVRAFPCTTNKKTDPSLASMVHGHVCGIVHATPCTDHCTMACMSNVLYIYAGNNVHLISSNF